MAYTVTSTEKNNQNATEAETKAMLYLMNFRVDSNEIYYFVVDFFNDVTGIDSLGQKAWDVQSKADKNLYGKKVGQYLVTLYKNYLSDLDFSHFILCVGSIAETTLKKKDETIFDISNFTESAQKSIFEGLKEEAIAKEYIDNNKVNDNNINEFIKKVTFVVNNKTKAEYIKKIISVNPTIIPADEYLNKIFDQIKNRQSNKKNINTENITINMLRDFEPYQKHLTLNEIKMLVLSRLIHKDGISKDVPLSFLPIVAKRELEDDQREFIEECQNDIFKILYDKNNVEAYWKLFEEVYLKVSINMQMTVENIFDILDKQKLAKVTYLNFNSAMYFIALIKDGLKK